MKKIKICVITLLLMFVASMAQAQQSAFQGTWIGDRNPVDRSAYRIVISGNNWQEFYNNQIEAAGTARFSAGRAELLLADGRLAWDLRLLAPGLIEQPISMFAGLYRFRLQSGGSSSSNDNRQGSVLSNSSLIGRWDLERVQNRQRSESTESLIFYDDGTVLFAGGSTARWEVRSGNRLVIGNRTYDVELSENGALLIFNYSGGQNPQRGFYRKR